MQDWSRIVGEAISQRRQDLDMTVECLAFKVGVSSETVYNLESGRCGPRGHNLFLIAKALQCSMDDLYLDVDARQISFRTGAVP